MFLLNLLHIILDGLFDSVLILLSFIVLSFGAGEKEAGFIISVTNAAITCAGLFTLFFSRRLGVFRVLCLSTLLLGLGFLANAFSPSLWLTGLAVIIGAAGFGIFHNVAFSFIAANTEKTSLGKSIGDFTAIGDIGRIPLSSLAGLLAAFTILGQPGWRFVLLAYGLAAVLAAAFILTSFRHKFPDPAPDSVPGKTSSQVLPAFSLLRRGPILLSLSAVVLDALASNQVFVFLPFLLFAKGIDPKVISAFALAFMGGCCVGKLLLGRIVDRFGAFPVFVASEAAMAALLVILFAGQGIVVIVTASLLLGIVTKGTVPVIQTILAELSGERKSYDEILSISSFLRGIANILAPLLFGFIAAAAGVQWNFAAMAVMAALAVAPMLILRNQSGRPSQAQSS